MTDGSEALRRWKLLKVALIDKRDPTETDSVKDISVRNFSEFGLFTKQRLYSKWERWSIAGVWEMLLLTPHYSEVCDVINAGKNVMECHGNYEKLMSTVNTTGYCCVWPSEEVLAWFLRDWFFTVKTSKHQSVLPSRLFDTCERICELGGGHTCLGGLMAATLPWPNLKEVILSDGNAHCRRNVVSILSKNRTAELLPKVRVNVTNLDWCRFDKDEEWKGLAESCDLVLLADCLFFEWSHFDLARSLSYLLKPNGICLLFAPLRGRSFEKFQELASNLSLKLRLRVTKFDSYASQVQALHNLHLKENALYHPDVHYPLCLLIEKHSETHM